MTNMKLLITKLNWHITQNEIDLHKYFQGEKKLNNIETF